MKTVLEALPELEEHLASLGPEPTKERLDALIALGYALRATEQWDRMQALATEASGMAQLLGDAHAESMAWARSLSSSTSARI